MPSKKPKRRRSRRRKGLPWRKVMAVLLSGAGLMIWALCAGVCFALAQARAFLRGFGDGWAGVSPAKRGDRHDG